MQYLVDEVSGIKLKLGLLGMNIDDVVAVHDGLATQLDFLSLKSSFWRIGRDTSNACRSSTTTNMCRSTPALRWWSYV